MFQLRLRLAVVAAALAALAGAANALASPSGIVVSQVYGGGGNAGTVLKNDFVELHNRTGTAVDLTGWSVQYASSTGTSWQVTTLIGSIAPGGYYLVQEAAGTGGTTNLPAPDATGSIAMAAGSGKVVLVDNSAQITSGTSCPSVVMGALDIVGYGAANCFETAATPLLTNTTAALRKSQGCADSDDNSTDFSTGPPAPRNSAFAAFSCDEPPVDVAPTVALSVPAPGATGVPWNSSISLTFSEPVDVTGSWFTIDCASSGVHAASVSGGGTGFTLAPADDFAPSETCTVTIASGSVSDQDTNDPPDTMAADHVFSFQTAAPPVDADVVISEVYGGGGNSGATYTNDYIELYNPAATAVDLTGWSVQYAGATATTWQVTTLEGSIGPGEYYLVQEAAGTGGTVPLPGPDETGVIAMSAANGKVGLVSSTGALSGGCPTGSPIQDFVGYGSANCAETAATPALSNTTAALRKDNGAQDTGDNSEDFVVGAPDPQATADSAPFVASSTPAAGGLGAPVDTSVAITFSEPVDATSDWFTINCTTTGVHSATVSGGPTSFSLDPGSDFVKNESCTVTVVAANVTDQDSNDPPDAMVANRVITFHTVEAVVCGDPATRIHAVQGSGAASPLDNTIVTVEGVVVGDYQAPGQFNGFYIQEEAVDQDANPLTSEGVFVLGGPTNVSIGDVVRVRGTADEIFAQTEINSLRAAEICSSDAPTPAASASLPVANVSDLERFEGMRVHFAQELTATEVFNLGRFGEVSLSGAGRLYNPTAVASPGPEAQAVAAQNDRSRIILDDANNEQNIDPTRYPLGGLSALNTLRVGDTLAELEGVLGFAFGNYRVQPVGTLDFAETNPRTPAPAPVGGNLNVASFNVLNYFNGDGLGGGFPTSRGAESQFEFDRQEAKIVSALKTIDGDIVGLMEIENDAAPNSALEELVAALNEATAPGTYSFIDTGVIGTDEIKVALIYKPEAVTPVGGWEILTSTDDPRFIDTLNRPTLAQTFTLNSSGQALTVAVNHLKSKGSACAGDPDTGDGSGNCNLTRTQAAAALADWLEGDPTGSGDPDFLIIGDLNSYTFETPITALESEGYTNLLRAYHGLAAYSYVFEGESGYLDHALATSLLTAQVTGVSDWHINPDEPTVLDYNVNFKSEGEDGEDGQIESFYDPGPYRSSDHDPVIVGVQLVTYDSLCALTTGYSSSVKVAQKLCDDLAKAKRLEGRGNAKKAHIDQFIRDVEKQAGKAFTDAEAAILIGLAKQL